MKSNKRTFDEVYLDNLAIEAKLGSEEAINEIDAYFLPICLKIASAMIKNYKINLDTSEPGDYLLIIHETTLKSTSLYNPFAGDFKSYYMASFVTNLYTELEKEYSDNIALFNAISLDSVVAKSATRTYHEIISSDSNDDPRRDYELSEVKSLFFADSNIIKAKSKKGMPNEAKARLQGQLLLFRFHGYPVDEIAKIFGVSKYVVKRLMFDDNSNMPLGKIKKIFNKK